MRTFGRVRSTAALACACTLAAALTAFADNKPRTVNVTVRDAAGTPLSGAYITLHEADESKAIITTDSNGIAQVSLSGEKLVASINAAGMDEMSFAAIVAADAKDLYVTIKSGEAVVTPAPSVKHVQATVKQVPPANATLRAPANQDGGEIAGGIAVSCATGAYCQLPTLTSRQSGVGGAGTLANTSDRDPALSFRVAENIESTGQGVVSSMCWWGLYLDFVLFVDCGPGGGDSFEVTLYNDDAGGSVPGTVKAGPMPVTVTTKFATGNLVFAFVGEYQYEGTFAPVAVADGECYWIEITNDTPAAGANCAWLWDTAEPGDGRGAQFNAGTWGAFDWDSAVCVNKAGTTCPLPLGACCVAGVCSAMTSIDCAAAGGGYGGDGVDCAGVVCPANDECAAAASIACNTSTAVDNTFAGNNPLDPAYSCHFGGPAPGIGTLWYSFVATDVSALVDTLAGPGSDSLVAVYDACGGTELACNDDAGGGLLSRVCATGLSVGTTYIIQFATFSDFDRGAYTLTLTCPCPPAPANDECATPETLACNGVTTLDNTTATENVGDPLLSCYSGGPAVGFGTLWYAFVATDVSAQADTLTSAGGDSLLAIYDACGGAELACNDDAAGGLLSRVCASGLTVGSTYIVEFATFSDAARGPYTLQLTCPCPPGPANDECAMAAAITCNSSTAYDNTDATTAAGDPLFPCFFGGPNQGFGTLWFAFVATDVSALISTDGITAGDSVVQVLDACGGAILGCDDDGDEGLLSKLCVTGLAVGSTYIIEVSSFSAFDQGAYELDLVCPCPPPPTNEECTGAIAVAVPSSTAGDTSSALPSGAPNCSGVGAASPDSWYSLMGTGNTITASFCDGQTAFDSAIEVYCGNCAALTCVVGNDDFCGLQTQVSWCSQTVPYLIRVHGFGAGAGPFVLNITDDGTACTPTVNCLPTGACCKPDDTCVITDQPNCENVLLGDYAGDNTPCATSGGTPITYTMTNPPVAIPDGPAGGNATDTITVADSRVMGDVNVSVTIDHTWVGDLNVDITHVASGTTVRVIERPLLAGGSDCNIAACCGCAEDNYAGVVLDDEAAGGAIEAQCPVGGNIAGSFTPFAPLGAFDGLNSASDWTITVCDGAGADVGTILSWSITTEVAGEETCPLCPGELGDANCNGSVDFFDIDPFLQALFDLPGYQLAFCGGSICAADTNCSGGIDFFDIDPFLDCLFSVCTCP